jgi:hypothetical protein
MLMIKEFRNQWGDSSVSSPPNYPPDENRGRSIAIIIHLYPPFCLQPKIHTTPHAPLVHTPPLGSQVSTS